MEVQHKVSADVGRGRRNLKTKSKDQVLTYLANDRQSALAMPRVFRVQKNVNAKAVTTHLERKQKAVQNTKEKGGQSAQVCCH